MINHAISAYGMTKLMQIWAVLTLPIFLASGCYAQNHPSDQLIEKQFAINEQWQTFTFDKPLVEEPYVQELQLLSCNQRYELVTTQFDKDNYFFTDSRFARLTDKSVISPEVMVVIDGKDYRLSLSASGYYTNGKVRGCISLGYSLYGLIDENTFYFPEGTQIEAIKLKANTSFSIDMIRWSAVNYWRVAKDRTWKDVHPSNIVDLANLPTQ